MTELLEVRVSSSTDDVEERASGRPTLTGADLELVDDFPNRPQQTVGLRFNGLDIPQGATIVNAYIQFQVDEVSTGAATLFIHGEDTDNAATFADINGTVSSRLQTATAATVAWSPPDWTTVGAAGVAQQTADISAIIQEIVSRPGWTANNSLALIITGSGTRTAEAYDGVAAAAPLLHIEWQLPSGSGVAFDTPPDGDGGANEIGELAAAGAVVGITASATDPDPGDTVTYSIDDPRFAIDANSGVITLSNPGALDHETEPAVTFNVTATSSDFTTATQAFTVSVLDDPEPVAFDIPPDADPSTDRISENAPSGTPVGITASATDLDAGDTVSYSIDDTRFAIDPATGVITRSATGTLDFQNEPAINVTVTATSSDTSTDTQVFTVDVLNGQQSATIVESRVSSSADDVEERASGRPTLTGADLELVDDFPNRPQQTVGLRFNGLDIPQGATIVNAYIQFQVDEVSTGAATLFIHGEDTDNAATFADINGTVSSRLQTATAATVAWSPPDWTTVGAAGVAQQTADISAIIQEIVSRPGWTANNSLALIITGSGTRTAEAYDGVAAAAPLLHIEYLPPGPVGPSVAFDIPPDSDSAADQIAENSGAGALVGITASATDPDPGDTVTYSIDDTRFNIDPNSGVITRSATGVVDFDTEPAITFTVTATSSDGSIATQDLTLDVLDVNELVAFDTPADADPAADQITENAAAGALVGITASATDPNQSDTVAYSIDDTRFAIDPNTGVITRSGTGALDSQNEPAITFTVTATSSDGSIATQDFTLDVLGANDPVAFHNPADADPAADRIVENAATGATVGITASAADPDPGDTVTYSIDDPRFAIDATTGVITRSGAGELDFETEPAITFTVTATSSDTSIATQDFTLDVLNGPEPVAFDIPPDADPSTDQISENAPSGTAVGIIASATASPADPDAGDIVIYSIDDPRFVIDADGVITRSATGVVDFETETQITVNVTATSGDGGRATQAFTLGVLDDPEPLAFDIPPDADPAADQIAENAGAGVAVGITASATDPDAGDTVTYSIDDPRFDIDPDTGVVTRSGTGVLDFETEPQITVTVTATSSDFSSGTQDFAIAVGDVNEVPVANADSATAQPGIPVVIDVLANDDLGDGVDSLTVDDTNANGTVSINADNTLTYTPDPLFTGPASFTYTITESIAGGGDSSTATVSVNVIPPQPPSSLSLVQVMNAWQWSPPSPDSSGIVYLDHVGTLLVSDGEVNEGTQNPPIFTGDNLFERNLDGTFVDTLTTLPFSDEPTGAAYNPTNHHLFFTDDTGTRSVYEVDPGQDGLYDTGDDIVTSFGTSAYGNSDPEGITYDTTRGFLHVVDGAGGMVYTIDPGANGLFDGVASAGGDDVVTSFSTAGLGIVDPEGIAYDPVFDLLYIIATNQSIAQVTITGDLVGMLDISSANVANAAGLAFGPGSLDPNTTSLYVAARGVDNNTVANENDGMVFEFSFDDFFA